MRLIGRSPGGTAIVKPVPDMPAAPTVPAEEHPTAALEDAAPLAAPLQPAPAPARITPSAIAPSVATPASTTVEASVVAATWTAAAAGAPGPVPDVASAVETGQDMTHAPAELSMPANDHRGRLPHAWPSPAGPSRQAPPSRQPSPSRQPPLSCQPRRSCLAQPPSRGQWHQELPQAVVQSPLMPAQHQPRGQQPSAPAPLQQTVPPALRQPPLAAVPLASAGSHAPTTANRLQQLQQQFAQPRNAASATPAAPLCPASHLAPCTSVQAAAGGSVLPASSIGGQSHFLTAPRGVTQPRTQQMPPPPRVYPSSTRSPPQVLPSSMMMGPPPPQSWPVGIATGSGGGGGPRDPPPAMQQPACGHQRAVHTTSRHPQHVTSARPHGGMPTPALAETLPRGAPPFTTATDRPQPALPPMGGRAPLHQAEPAPRVVPKHQHAHCGTSVQSARAAMGQPPVSATQQLTHTLTCPVCNAAFVVASAVASGALCPTCSDMMF